MFHIAKSKPLRQPRQVHSLWVLRFSGLCLRQFIPDYLTKHPRKYQPTVNILVRCRYMRKQPIHLAYVLQNIIIST